MLLLRRKKIRISGKNGKNNEKWHTDELVNYTQLQNTRIKIESEHKPFYKLLAWKQMQFFENLPLTFSNFDKSLLEVQKVCLSLRIIRYFLIKYTSFNFRVCIWVRNCLKSFECVLRIIDGSEPGNSAPGLMNGKCVENAHTMTIYT